LVRTEKIQLLFCISNGSDITFFKRAQLSFYSL
jgi:hypothetical protein